MDTQTMIWTDKQMKDLRKIMREATNNEQGFTLAATQLNRTLGAVRTKYSLLEGKRRTKQINNTEDTSVYTNKIHSEVLSDTITEGVRFVLTKTLFTK